MLKSIGSPPPHLREEVAEELAVPGDALSRFNTFCRIGSLRNPDPSGGGTRQTLVVVELIEARPDGPARALEPRDLDELGRRNVRLRLQQVLTIGSFGRERRRPFRRREHEALRIVERIAATAR